MGRYKGKGTLKCPGCGGEREFVGYVGSDWVIVIYGVDAEVWTCKDCHKYWIRGKK